MTKTNDIDDQLLVHKLLNDGRTNFCEWFDKIVDDFCEEQEIEE